MSYRRVESRRGARSRREPAAHEWGSNVRGTRRGSTGAQRSRSVVNRQWVIAVLVASVALVFASATEASSAESSPAPRRVAVSPRHSAAGASATATHAVRAHHGRRHHHRHRPGGRAPRITARDSGSAAGGSPPLPARRGPVAHHHAALGPAPHSFRPLDRNRTGGHGIAAESPTLAAASTAMSRLDFCPLPAPISHEDRLTSGRGPPRAGPDFDLISSPHPDFFSYSRYPITSGTQSDQHVLSRDRLESRPHASRLEGAVACLDSPSIGEPS